MYRESKNAYQVHAHMKDQIISPCKVLGCQPLGGNPHVSGHFSSHQLHRGQSTWKSQEQAHDIFDGYLEMLIVTYQTAGSLKSAIIEFRPD